MGIRAKQMLGSTFSSTEVDRLFTSTSIAGTKLANGAVDTTQLASDSVDETKIVSTAFGNGLTGGSGSAIAVEADSTSGGNVQPVNLASTGVGVDISAIAGTGIEADGSANLRLATQGAGIAGGNGSTLSLETNTDNFSPTFTGAGSWTFPAARLQISSDPSGSSDVARKAYVDSVAQGLDVHESVRLATTQDPAFEGSGAAYAPTGGTSGRGQITWTTGPTSLDGVTLANDDRILIKDGGALSALGTNAVAEVHSVDTVADSAGSLDGTYFIFYTTPNLGYYVWLTNGTATDPSPSAPAGVTYLGIQVSFTNGDTADTIASLIETAINGAYRQAAADDTIDCTVSRSSNALTITNDYGGSVTDVADGATATGFTFATDTQGTGLGPAVDGLWVRTAQNTWDRATDFDEDVEAGSGDFIFVEEGSNYDNTGWVVSSPNPITVGGAAGEPIFWTQFSGAGTFLGGNGLTLDGNTFNVGDAGKGVQVNADDLQIDASEIANNGLTQVSGGGNEHLLAVEPDITSTTTTEANAVNVGANGVSIKVDDSTLEGSAQGGGGAESLRLKDAGVTEAKLNTSVAGNGLTGGGGSALSVDPDSETGGNTQAVSVTLNGVGLDVSTIAGTGLEADGSANLRIATAAAGNGLTGGGGSALAVGAGNGITVNANDVAVNPAGLISGGAAEVDGDQLDIDWAPSNYTQDTGPAEVTTTAHLTAHLKGIDNALATAGGTVAQESVTTENITGTDTGLTDTLNNTPTSNASVRLFLNGVFQEQGSGKDYTVSGTSITWLASSGTAVDMDTSDVLTAVYEY